MLAQQPGQLRAQAVPQQQQRLARQRLGCMGDHRVVVARPVEQVGPHLAHATTQRLALPPVVEGGDPQALLRQPGGERPIEGLAHAHGAANDDGGARGAGPWRVHAQRQRHCAIDHQGFTLHGLSP